jgi:plastocyanin
LDNTAKEDCVRLRIALLGSAAAIAGIALAASGMASAAAPAKLIGTVGPGFTITLKSKGKKVTSLKPGKYTFVVSDKSSIHNFVLEQETRGRFEKDITTVGATGTKTMTIRLKRGEWKYYCAPHESTMHGEFKVT